MWIGTKNVKLKKANTLMVKQTKLVVTTGTATAGRKIDYLWCSRRIVGAIALLNGFAEKCGSICVDDDGAVCFRIVDSLSYFHWSVIECWSMNNGISKMRCSGRSDTFSSLKNLLTDEGVAA